MKARTAQANQIRGLLAEFGLTIPQGIAHIARRVPELIEDASNELPGLFRRLVASALVATVGDAKNFENGRQLAAWLGLVPRQHSSGGKNVLLGMSKRGDTYLRTLRIHGARSVIYRAGKKVEGWLPALIGRRNANVAAVALANKNARIVWALLAHDREFRPDYATAGAAA